MAIDGRRLPLALFTTGVLTLSATFITSAVLPHWWFGATIPAFSITGYDPLPAFLIFSIGLSAVGVMCVALGWIEYCWVETLRARLGTPCHGGASRAFLVCMISGALNCSALAWTDHRMFYKTRVRTRPARRPKCCEDGRAPSRPSARARHSPSPPLRHSAALASSPRSYSPRTC